MSNSRFDELRHRLVSVDGGPKAFSASEMHELAEGICDAIAERDQELQRRRAICLKVRDQLIDRSDHASWHLAFDLNYACDEVEIPGVDPTSGAAQAAALAAAWRQISGNPPAPAPERPAPERPTRVVLIEVERDLQIEARRCRQIADRLSGSSAVARAAEASALQGFADILGKALART